MTRPDWNDPSSASSEFSINLVDNSELFAPGGYDSHGYTVFMELNMGWEVLQQIIRNGRAEITGATLLETLTEVNQD